MDLDWYKVIDRLYIESSQHARRAEIALKENQIESSHSSIIVAGILTSIADALKAGLKYKGD